MFQDTIALKDNPFGPSFPVSHENRTRLKYLTNLDRMPLRIDQCADELKPLLCTEILDFEAHMKRFHEVMTALGYGFDGEGRRSLDSLLIVIRGARGAGKTTLGAWMISEFARLPGDPVRCLHLTEPAVDTDEARIKALCGLHDSVTQIPLGNHVAALVENVSAVSLNSAIARFNDLQDWPRLFVLTTHNLKLLDADEKTLGGTARIEVFTLRGITAADAESYVAHRLPQYREPRRAEIDAVSPVFPLPVGLAGRFVQQSEDAGKDSVVLRGLNAHFRSRLARHAQLLRARPDHISVSSAPPDALVKYLMGDV